MTRHSRFLALALLASLLAPPASAEPARPIPGAQEYLPTRAAARSEVVLFSDADGWSDADAGLAERLRMKGVIVVGIDTPVYEMAVDAKARNASTSSRRSKGRATTSRGSSAMPPI